MFAVKRLRFLAVMVYSAAMAATSMSDRDLPPRETFPERSTGNGSRRPTMKDVATLAGVSLATVSRVINADGSVRPDLADKVRDAVALLGYRRDLTATNLRRADRASATIGLVFDDVANPFHAALLRGVESVARTRGVLPLVGSSDEDPDRERELAEAFLSRRVDGLIVVPSGTDHSYLRTEIDAGVALVFVDRPPAFIDADCVLSDNAGGAFAATSHLLAAGHRRIGFLGDQQRIFTAVERLRGYREALAARGVAFDERLVRMELHDSASASAATAELLSGVDPPTALFSAQNLISIGTIQRLRQLDLHRRVALVGFDDLTLADAIDPGLTVVAQDANALGRMTAELLFERLDGRTGPSRRVELPTTVIERGTGELRP
jgi:LacI family transcriptional regulator